MAALSGGTQLKTERFEFEIADFFPGPIGCFRAGFERFGQLTKGKIVSFDFYTNNNPVIKIHGLAYRRFCVICGQDRFPEGIKDPPISSPRFTCISDICMREFDLRMLALGTMKGKNDYRLFDVLTGGDGD